VNGMPDFLKKLIKGDGHESDAPIDTGVAHSRDIGGREDESAPDPNSTTGTTNSGEFVGRVQGQDVGYAGETGAERRAEADRES
jgi:hypothetical protein